MAMMTAQWPRRRLQLRSALSATMPIAWIWVAATALIPYFLIGRGRGAGSLEFLGIARTTWLSYHVWSSITVGLLTMVHVLLNRRGVTRSYRIIGGASRATSRVGQGADDRGRSFTWVAALALLVVTLGGSLAYAAVDGDRAGTGGNNQGVERVEDRHSDGPQQVTADAEQSATGLSQGIRRRGGRGGGG